MVCESGRKVEKALDKRNERLAASGTLIIFRLPRSNQRVFLSVVN